MTDPSDELTSDAITADFRILQRKRGHRFSLDDLATAWQASLAAPNAKTYIDLGCGIGSVLLMLAWKLPRAHVYGIEALELSYRIALKNLALNGLEPRTRVIHGDLREVTRDWGHAKADLVTGTPPYLPAHTALASPDPQRAAARIELRGGIEDYLAAAGRVLAPRGRVVVCSDGRYPERVLDGARAAQLIPLSWCDVFARHDAEHALFGVWTLAPGTHRAAPLQRTRLHTRDASGARTPEADAMRRHFGITSGRPDPRAS